MGYLSLPLLLGKFMLAEVVLVFCQNSAGKKALIVPFQHHSSLHQSLKEPNVGVSFVNQTSYLNVGIVLLDKSREL